MATNDPRQNSGAIPALSPAQCSTALIAISEALDALECRERACLEKAMEMTAAAHAYHDAQLALRAARNKIEAP